MVGNIGDFDWTTLLYPNLPDNYGDVDSILEQLNLLFEIDGTVTIKHKFNLDPFPSTLSGENALATGEESIAYAKNSTAMGDGTVASGENSTAMGKSTRASGDNSTAMGNNTEATADYSTAMGADTEASGFASTTMGVDTTASGNDSTAMGNHTTASGNDSTAMGFQTRVGLLKTIGDALTSILGRRLQNLRTHCTEYTNLPVADAVALEEWQTTFDLLKKEYNDAGIKLIAMKKLCADENEPKLSDTDVLELFTKIAALISTPTANLQPDPDAANTDAARLATFIIESQTADNLTKLHGQPFIDACTSVIHSYQAE